MTQPQAPVRRSAVVTGLLTTMSFAVMTGAAALALVVLDHKFGHGEQTDGFFIAYGVYVLLVLAATAFRVVVLPSLARAAQSGRLAAEVIGYGAAFALPVVPLVIVALAASDQFASLLTGGEHPVREHTAAAALVWLVPAAAAQLYAGLAASSLAALDDYGTAAFSFAAGAVTALVVFVVLADGHGPVALAWGLAVGGFLSLAILSVALLRRRGPVALPGVELRLLPRLGELMQGVSLPLALQGLYVVANRFAGGPKAGNVTIFGNAYLISAALVALASAPLSLVSSVPLTRRGVENERSVVHVVSTSWLALTLVAAVAGVFALAGSEVARLLGPDFGGSAGEELSRLVVYLSPWMISSIGVGVTLPLLFVLGRRRPLPILAVAALLVDIPIEWVCREAFGLAGVALGLAITTVLVFAALLAVLSLETLVAVASRLVVPIALIGSLGLLSFGAASQLLAPVPAALAGLLLYTALLALLRPRGLRAAWSYVRALH